jgi:hypothetical protein
MIQLEQKKVNVRRMNNLGVISWIARSRVRH